MDEVLASFAAVGLPDATDVLNAIYAQLIELPNNIPKYNFDDLNAAICAEIFERCAGYPCPDGRAEAWCDKIIEPNIPEIISAAAASVDGCIEFYTKGF